MASSSRERDVDPIRDHSVPADADFSAAGSDEANPSEDADATGRDDATTNDRSTS